MRIIRENEVDVQSIIQSLKAGDTLIYPTETCYGLGCDATNSTAVDKIFEIKHRQKDKTLLVLVPDIEMIMRYVAWTPTLQNLADKYWPGPLTVVSPARERARLPRGVIGGDNTIAFRVSSHPLSTEIARGLNAPLVSTSANLAAEQSPYDIADVVAMFEKSEPQPDILIDAGQLSERSPSTIVRVVGETVEVLRQGGIVVE